MDIHWILSKYEQSNSVYPYFVGEVTEAREVDIPHAIVLTSESQHIVASAGDSVREKFADNFYDLSD